MRKRRTEEEWFELVKRFDLEIMSLEKYCEVNEISTASYYVYKRKLKNETPSFLPVVFESEIEHDFIFESNGYKLKVSEDISPSHLKLLLKATHDH